MLERQQLWTQATSPEFLVKMRSQAITKVLLIQMKPDPCFSEFYSRIKNPMTMNVTKNLCYSHS